MGCEIDKQRYRTQCEIEKTARKADCERLKAMEKLICEAEKEAARLDCERLKAMEIAGCEINQAWLNQWGSYEVGRLTGHVSVTNGWARACFRGLKVTGDLSQVDLDTTISANALVTADITFTPYNLANIACVGEWSGSVTAEARADEQPVRFHADVKSSQTSAKDLQLDSTISPRQISGNIDPPPLTALVEQNPKLKVICAPAVGVARIAGLIDTKEDPFKKSGFEIPIPEQKLPIVVQPIRIEIQGMSLVLDPTVEAKALVFTLR